MLDNRQPVNPAVPHVDAPWLDIRPLRREYLDELLLEAERVPVDVVDDSAPQDEVLVCERAVLHGEPPVGIPVDVEGHRVISRDRAERRGVPAIRPLVLLHYFGERVELKSKRELQQLIVDILPKDDVELAGAAPHAGDRFDNVRGGHVGGDVARVVDHLGLHVTDAGWVPAGPHEQSR